MRKFRRIQTTILFSVAAILIVAAPAAARSHRTPMFEYVGGTEALPDRCGGKLELLETALVFECPKGRITAPYESITLMQYRSRVSREVRKMKLPWALKPPDESSKHNLFFTVLYSVDGRTHAMILRVPPETMRPYLAEIELRTGRRVNVEHTD
jgi:hypothetical protein